MLTSGTPLVTKLGWITVLVTLSIKCPTVVAERGVLSLAEASTDDIPWLKIAYSRMYGCLMLTLRCGGR